jgi:hypothetical protein
METKDSSSIFWDIMPYGPLKGNRHFGGLVYSSTLKMEETCSSETSVDFQQTTQRYILEDKTLHNHGYEDPKSFHHVHSSGPYIKPDEFNPHVYNLFL